MNHNPYTPPKAFVADADASGAAAPKSVEQLYSVAQITVGAFLGGPFAAAWLMGSNYADIGDAARAKRTRLYGALLTIVVFTLAYFIPDNVPNTVFGIAFAAAAYKLADTEFGTLLHQHLGEGGQLRSWWRAAGISLLVAAIVVALVVCVLMLLSSMGLVEF
jgi:hypothetical protein